MTELMPFPHQTAVKPHISQQWLERSRSKLERQGHGPALDNLWSSDTLALYPIVSDEACERMSADRRVLQQIKNKQNIKSRHLAFYEAGTACFWVLYGCVLMTAPAFARQLQDTCDRSTYTNPKPTIKPLQATGHACVPSLRHVSGGGDGIPTKDVTTTGDTTFGLYGKSDPSGDPTANGAGEQQQKQQQQQQRQSAHGTDTNGVIRATNTNGAIRAALASYAPPTAPYAPPSASYAPQTTPYASPFAPYAQPTATARGGLYDGV